MVEHVARKTKIDHAVEVEEATFGNISVLVVVRLGFSQTLTNTRMSI